MDLLPQPVYEQGFKFEDLDNKFIAEYLVTNTNNTFSTALGTNIIKTYRTWNDLFIPLTDFPVLKVYKNSETPFSFNSKPVSTGFNISYILAFTQAPKTGDVSGFVAKEICRNLLNGSKEELWQLDFNTPVQIEYDITIDPKNQIKKYANITCNIFTME